MKKFMNSVGWIFIALIAGGFSGILFPKHVVWIFPITKFLLQLIKATATPLVFFAVLEAIVTYHVKGQDFFKMLAVTLINASCAILIGLGVANFFNPGQYLQFLVLEKPLFHLKRIDFLELFTRQFPSSIVQPFAENLIMPVIIIAIAIGFAWR